MKKETIFFTREENDTKIVYKLKIAWVPFVFAWTAIIGIGLCFLATTQSRPTAN